MTPKSLTPKDPFTSSLVVDRLTGYHPNRPADLWGNKKATFCHQNCCEWPIVTSNPQEVHNRGASELLTRPDRAFPCRDRGVWHVFGDAVFVWLWPIADFTCVFWNAAQSGHGLSKLWFDINDINIHMYIRTCANNQQFIARFLLNF